MSPEITISQGIGASHIEQGESRRHHLHDWPAKSTGEDELKTFQDQGLLLGY